MNYENTSDLKKGVLHRCGELDDGTSEYDEKVVEYLNRAHLAVLSGATELNLDVGQPWSWAQKKYPSILTLVPGIKNISVSVTNNSTSITLGIAPPNNLQDWYVRVNGQADAYRIASHTGIATAATLDGVYTGETGTALGCTIFKVDYDLDASVLRLVPSMRCAKLISAIDNDSGILRSMDKMSFDMNNPLGSIIEGTPTHFCEVYKDTSSMTPRIRVNRVVTELTRVEYNHIAVPSKLVDSNSSIPLVPRDHRIVLEYFASYYLMMDKNDNRAAEFRNLTIAEMNAMIRADRIQKIQTSPDYGRVISRPDQMGQVRRFGWRDGK